MAGFVFYPLKGMTHSTKGIFKNDGLPVTMKINSPVANPSNSPPQFQSKQADSIQGPWNIHGMSTPAQGQMTFWSFKGNKLSGFTVTPNYNTSISTSPGKQGFLIFPFITTKNPGNYFSIYPSLQPGVILKNQHHSDQESFNNTNTND